MIKLTMRGTVVAASEAVGWAAARETFRQQHCVRLAQVLDPSVVAYALSKLRDERNGFYLSKQRGGGRKVRLLRQELTARRDHPVSILFHILLNQRALLQAIDNVCGFGGKLQNVYGRYAEMHAAGDHFDSWHTDTNQSRILGFSINLSPKPYAGGQFQLRDAQTQEILGTVDSQLGDCHLFRIHRRLEHWVAPVAGNTPRCCYAGWFRGEDAESAWQVALTQPRTIVDDRQPSPSAAR